MTSQPEGLQEATSRIDRDIIIPSIEEIVTAIRKLHSEELSPEIKSMIEALSNHPEVKKYFTREDIIELIETELKT